MIAYILPKLSNNTIISTVSVLVCTYVYFLIICCVFKLVYSWDVQLPEYAVSHLLLIIAVGVSPINQYEISMYNTYCIVDLYRYIVFKV